MSKLTRQEWQDRRTAGWKNRAGRWVTGLTVYLLLSGLAIYLLPFSRFNQHSVVVHTVVGLAFVLPFVFYTWHHIRAYWTYPSTHIKYSGYLAAIMTAVCSVSGLVLTYEGALGTRLIPAWQTIHILTTFGVLVFLGAHLVPLWLRARKGAPDPAQGEVRIALRGHSYTTVGVSVGLLAATLVLTSVVRPVVFANVFPEGYDMQPYEGASPFSPSLAMTSTGGAFDSRSLAGSQTCGTARCHQEIYEEWLPSAHRYASMDVGFQAIQGVMAKQNGAESTRYCGGCHDPISLFSGTKNIGVAKESLTNLAGYQEGISCLACHAIEKTDVSGNANYVTAQPERYVWELREGPVAGFLSDFLIRTYPQQHVESLSRRMFKTPEFCAACHKQFIDEEVNQVGWVQLQNQFDNWKASRWHDEDNPERTIECRECHMPLTDSRDPAAGDDADANRSANDGKHRIHSFLGANQYIPALMELEGADEHVANVERWLKGDYDIPEIKGKWADGPAVPIEIEAPESVQAGEKFQLLVHIINNKVGHDFPTGPLDIIQAWVEIDVTDAGGQVLFSSGKRDERNFIESGAFMFKAEPVDRYGNLIDRHNLWEMVGVRFKRSLFPGSEEVASYSLECSGAQSEPGQAPLDETVQVQLPAEVVGPLTVKAKLNYRKFDQYLLNFTFGEEAGLTATVTEMSSAEAVIQLAGSPGGGGQ
jgi:hypothetical protein